MAKNSGCVSDYARERMDALMMGYERYVSGHRHIVMAELCREVVNSPCPRFWVSEFRASVVIAAMMRGDDLKGMRATKREMFTEIYLRVKRLREALPHIPLCRLISTVVNSPAPKFYLAPETAKIMIYKHKKEWFARKMKLLKFSPRTTGDSQ